jgi:hypothetical protein
MRAVLLSAVVLGLVGFLSGCNNTTVIPKDTVAFDSKRDKNPDVVGPGNMGAPQKGSSGGAAPTNK